MNGYICWIEYYNEVQGKTVNETVALTADSYVSAAKVIEGLYSCDLVSMKLFALEDEVIIINDEIAQKIIKGEIEQ